LIGGAWRGSSETRPNENPSDLGDVVGWFDWSDAAGASDAVDAARAALPTWRRSNPQRRSDLLRRVGDLLLERSAVLGRLLAREEGKLVSEGSAEVVRSAHIFHYFAGEAVRSRGDFFPGLRDGVNIAVEAEAVGVVTLITPWNFPMAVPAWKTAAALAFGNTVILKASEHVPASAVALAQVLTESGVPAGVFNLLIGEGSLIGETLIAGSDAVSFTGSTPVGRVVLGVAAKHMVKVQLELGGKNPLVVLADADLDLAVDVAFQGGFLQTGQRCTASGRLLVAERIYDGFVERLTKRVADVVVGSALDPNSVIGPVANALQLDKNLSFVADAQREGAELLCGGQQLERATRGYYFAPALLTGVEPHHRLAREEVFGPVVPVIRIGDLDDAIAQANDTAYALCAGVCTRSLHAAEKFRREVDAGMVMINAPTAGVDYHAPFGGRAPSGYGGREQGAAAIQFYTENKTTYSNPGVD
jgi:aldehyde dehydrogenase (NAD+)